MHTFTVAERRNRLAHKHFLSATEPPPITQLVSGLIGLHASDPATPYLSLWARSPGFVTADLDGELYQRRSAVRHLAMRRTLWVVAGADLPAIQAAASDRVAAAERRRLVSDVQKAGVAVDGEVWVEQAGAAALRHLGENGPATSTKLRSALPELAGTYDPAPGKPWGGPVPLAPRVLTLLSARGDILRGLNDGAWTASRPRWVLRAHSLAPPDEARPANDATAELTRRWLRAFGPASAADIKWWFGTTLTSVRKTLADIGAVQVDLHGSPGGVGWALPDELEAAPEVPPWGALLPGLDVTAMGWFDRDWYVGAHRGQVFDRNGNAGPTAWWDGRVVGGWYQDDSARVRLQLLEDPGRNARRVLQRRADELTSWLDGVRISPRFPSPLSKAGTRSAAGVTRET